MNDLSKVFKSVLEADRAAVVICDLEHKIIYMNPASISKYEKWGGKDLLGRNLLDCHNDKSKEMINKVVDWFKASKDNNLVYTSYYQEENKDIYMVALRDDSGDLIAYYEKHEYRDRETMKMYEISTFLTIIPQTETTVYADDNNPPKLCKRYMIWRVVSA